MKKTEESVMPKDKPRGFIIEPEEWMIDLIKEHGSTIKIGEKTYYHLPFWWEMDESYPDMLSWYHMNIIPQELKDFLVKSRMGGNNPKIDERQFPQTNDEIPT